MINQLRAVLLERGITVPQRRRVLERRLPGILAEERNGLSPRIRHLIEDMRGEWRNLDRRIDEFDAEFAATAKREDACRRLCEIPGIGLDELEDRSAYYGIKIILISGRHIHHVTVTGIGN